MAEKMTRQAALAFLKKHGLGVLSTVDNLGRPEAAVVEYSETDRFEIIFDTSIAFRKYPNLRRNPQVAFVVGWDDGRTLQIEGTARELEGDELLAAQRIHKAKLSDVEKFERRSDIRYFKITPTWARYCDFSVDPWELTEVALSNE